MGENQFDEMFAPLPDEVEEENYLSNLRFLSLTVTIQHTQLSDLFRRCQLLSTLRLHLFDMVRSSTTMTTSSASLSRRQLREMEARRAAADNPFPSMSLPSLEELQLTSCKDVAMIEERTNGKIPREFLKAANQLPNLKKFSTNIFPNVNGYKDPETFMSLAMDRATCLLPPLMKTLALKCKKFTQWRDIRNLLGKK